MSKLAYLLRSAIIKKDNKRFRNLEAALKTMVCTIADLVYLECPPKNIYKFIEDFMNENMNYLRED